MVGNMAQHPDPMTWRQLMETLERIEVRLLRVLAMKRLPSAARGELLAILGEDVLPALRRGGGDGP